MLVNNIKAGSDRLARLTGLDDPGRRDELIAALDELVRTCPDELLDKLGKKDFDACRQKVERARKDLQAFVKTADAEACKVLAQVLANGMTLVRDDAGNVIALERPIKAELEQFRQRVEQFKKTVIQENLEEFARDRVQPKFKRLTQLSEAAQEAKNDGELERIAQQEVPQAVADLRDELKALQGKIIVARDELKDTETGVEIATADKRAADLLKEAADLRERKGGLTFEQAVLRERQADLLITQAGLQIQQKQLEAQAAAKRSTLNQDKLRHIYAICRLCGVDPQVPAGDETPHDSLALTGDPDGREPARATSPAALASGHSPRAARHGAVVAAPLHSAPAVRVERPCAGTTAGQAGRVGRGPTRRRCQLAVQQSAHAGGRPPARGSRPAAPQRF